MRLPREGGGGAAAADELTNESHCGAGAESAVMKDDDEAREPKP